MKSISENIAVVDQLFDGEGDILITYEKTGLKRDDFVCVNSMILRNGPWLSNYTYVNLTKLPLTFGMPCTSFGIAYYYNYATIRGSDSAKLMTVLEYSVDMYNEEGYIVNVGDFAGVGLYNEPFNSTYLDGTIDPCLTPYYNGTWRMNVVGFFNQTISTNESLQNIPIKEKNTLGAITADPCVTTASSSCISWGWGIGFIKSQLFLGEVHPVVSTTGMLMHWIEFYWPTTEEVTLVLTIRSLTTLPQDLYYGTKICQLQNSLVKIKSSPLTQNFTFKNIRTDNLYYITLFNDPNIPAPVNLTITISFYNQTTNAITDPLPWYAWMMISLGIFLVTAIVVIITVYYYKTKPKNPETQPLNS